MAARTGRARRAPAARWVAVLAAVSFLVGCGEVVNLADPAHDAASAVPSSSETAAPPAGAGITPATVTPTPTPTPTSTGSGGGGGGDDGGGGGGTDGPPGTVLTGGSPTRLTFGMHVNKVVEGAWPDVTVGAFRILSADSTWGSLEPSPGQWNFTRLDARVANAGARGAPVLLVLSHPPTWASSRPDLEAFGGSPAPPRNMEEWRRYVSTVASRYAGRIEGYEIWNEPNLPQFFVGTPQQLGELTRVSAEAINAVDPAAKVVSAGFSARTSGAEAYFRSYVASGIASSIDVVGIHIYPHVGLGPEAMVGLAQQFRSIANSAGLGDKPMWNTEIGYGRTPDYLISDAAAASLILRTYIIMPAAGMSRNYWYMWDDRSFIGLYLVGPDGQPTAAAYRFSEAQRWVSGSQIDRCSNETGIWVCTVRHADGPTVTIMWSLGGEADVRVPAGATIAYRFGGDSAGVGAGSAYRVGLTPVMFSPSTLPSLG